MFPYCPCLIPSILLWYVCLGMRTCLIPSILLWYTQVGSGMTSDYFFIATFHLTTPTTATPATAPPANAHAGNGYTNANSSNYDRINGGITLGPLHNHARPSTLSNITRTRTLAGLLFVSSYYLENAGLATAQ